MASYADLGDVRVQSVVAADPIEGYRVRAKLVVDGERVGLFERGSHRVVDVPGCRVLHPAVVTALDGIRRLLPLPGRVSAIDLRHTAEGTLCALVVAEGAPDHDVRAAVAALSEGVPSLAGIAVSRKESGSARVLGGVPVVEAGLARARCRVREGGPYHLAAHGAFAQAHPGQQARIVERILEVIEARSGRLAGATVLELFSGSGALALELAARGARVTAVEAFEPAARLALEAASEQGLVLASEVGDAAAVVHALVERGRRFDAIVVNPPRRGLSPGLREALSLLAPRLVVYVSCEPATLSRDLSDLVRKGFALDGVAPFDMIPLSEEVEALVVLQPGEPPLPHVLYRDSRLLAVAKPPHEVMASQGEAGQSLLDRVRRLPDAARAAPVHRLDAGTSGVALFALHSEHVPALASALAAGDKQYTALARGVVRDKGSIRRALVERGRPHEARTRYVRRAIVGGHSLVTAFPDEGRKHQVRRHLAAIGHAVVGDERYGHLPTNQHLGARHFLDRPFLHLGRLVLDLEGRSLEIEAPLPPDLGGVLESLRRGGSDPTPR
jgi:23S rRNA (uracil1939-C5)-methyltransferase